MVSHTGVVETADENVMKINLLKGAFKSIVCGAKDGMKAGDTVEVRTHDRDHIVESVIKLG